MKKMKLFDYGAYYYIRKVEKVIKMIVKLSKIYKGVNIEVSAEMSMDSGKTRKNLAQQLVWAMEDVDEKFPCVGSNGTYSDGKLPYNEDDLEDEEGEREYLLPTAGQKEYLRKLGLPESKIAKIKTKEEASALITKLQKGGK